MTKLTKRQEVILKNIIDNYSNNEPITSSILADKVNLTPKTIQKEISEINDIICEYGMNIESVAGKGYKFHIENIHIAKQYFSNNSVFDQGYRIERVDGDDRVKYILGTLLSQKQPVLSDKLADNLFISRSQLSADIKKVKEVAKKYDLTIVSKARLGLSIAGTEMDKRKCLINEKLINDINIIDFDEIASIVAEVLLDHHYSISDLVFENLVYHIGVSINRIFQGFDISDNISFNDYDEIEREIVMSRVIFEKIKKRIGFEYNERECIYLAINLKSKELNKENQSINEEVNAFIFDVLSFIKEQYGADLFNDLQLRLNLGLHIQSLLIRAKSKFMIKNSMLPVVKQDMLLAYDIAMQISEMLFKRFHIRITEDEASFLAIYLNTGLSKHMESSLGANVLIVIEGRNSELLLFKYSFQSHFGKMINKLDVVYLNQFDKVNVSEYDVIFTTTRIEDASLDNIVNINFYLSSMDLIVVENKLSEINQKKLPTKFFTKDHFFSHVKGLNKEELLKKYCKIIEEKVSGLDKFYESVLERESYADTIFDNGIALAHPVKLFDAQSIVLTLVLDNPIDWGSGKVNIVFICQVKNGNKDDLRDIYNVFSGLINNKSAVNQIIKNQTYGNFIDVISNLNNCRSKL